LNIAPIRQRISGFSLIEMMVAIAVLAILASVAAPAYQGMIAGNQVSATTNEILELLATAQAEARNRQTSVNLTIASTTDGQKLSIAPAGDNSNVLNSLLIRNNANLQLSSTFSAIRFRPDGMPCDNQTDETQCVTTANKSITISSTSYSSRTRNIQILGSGKVILVNQ